MSHLSLLLRERIRGRDAEGVAAGLIALDVGGGASVGEGIFVVCRSTGCQRSQADTSDYRALGAKRLPRLFTFVRGLPTPSKGLQGLIPRGFQGAFKLRPRSFQGASKGFQGASKGLPRRFQDASKRFQGASKGASKALPSGLQGASAGCQELPRDSKGSPGLPRSAEGLVWSSYGACMGE